MLAPFGRPSLLVVTMPEADERIKMTRHIRNAIYTRDQGKLVSIIAAWRLRSIERGILTVPVNVSNMSLSKQA